MSTNVLLCNVVGAMCAIRASYRTAHRIGVFFHAACACVHVTSIICRSSHRLHILRPPTRARPPQLAYFFHALSLLASTHNSFVPVCRADFDVIWLTILAQAIMPSEACAVTCAMKSFIKITI